MPTLVFSSVTKTSRNLLQDFDLVIRKATFLSVSHQNCWCHSSQLSYCFQHGSYVPVDWPIFACLYLIDILGRVAEESTIEILECSCNFFPERLSRLTQSSKWWPIQNRFLSSLLIGKPDSPLPYIIQLKILTRLCFIICGYYVCHLQ